MCVKIYIHTHAHARILEEKRKVRKARLVGNFAYETFSQEHHRVLLYRLIFFSSGFYKIIIQAWDYDAKILFEAINGQQ